MSKKLNVWLRDYQKAAKELLGKTLTEEQVKNKRDVGNLAILHKIGAFKKMPTTIEEKEVLLKKFPVAGWVTPLTIATNLVVLRNIGVKDSRIVGHARLLGRNPKVIHQNYENLKSIGLNDRKIAASVALLGRDPKTIEKNMKKLKDLGLSNSKIITNAQLLWRDPQTIKKNYENLKKLGLSDRKISAYADLLGRDPQTIQKNFENLEKLGIKRTAIAHSANLLLKNPYSIQRNYSNLKNIGLSDKKIAINASLLTINPETIRRNAKIIKELGADVARLKGSLGLREKIFERIYLFAEEGIDIKKSGTIITLSTTKLKAKIDYMKSKGLGDEIKRSPGLIMQNLSTLIRKYDTVSENEANRKALAMNMEYGKLEDAYKEAGKSLKLMYLLFSK